VTAWIALGLASVAAACVRNDAPGDGELLRPLTVTPDTLSADGWSTAAVTLCASDDAGRDPDLTAALTATAGSWVAAPDGGTQRTSFALDHDGCRTIRWLAPQSLYSPALIGSVGNPPIATTMAMIALTPAALEVPVLSVDGALVATGTSSITVTAVLRARSGGAPTLGTYVDYTVLPKLGAVAYFTAPRRELTTGNAVSSTLLVSASGLTSITVRAVATTSDGERSPTASLTIPALPAN
jgi:hypothetical protein